MGDWLGRDVLDARIAVLEMAVMKLPGVTPETIAAQRPGGSANRDKSATGALSYLQWLSTEYGKGPLTPKAASKRWDTLAMDDLRAALAADPVHVALSNGDCVAVYPKGEQALHRLACNQVALKWATTRWLHLTTLEEQSAASLVALQSCADLVAYLQSEFAEIVTHPGAWIPWDEESSRSHPVAAWTRELTPSDHLALRAAYLEVNLLRNNAIAERTRAFANGGDPMPLAAFLGVMADELHVQPERFTREYSLGEIFASNFAKFESTERAKAKADAERPTT